MKLLHLQLKIACEGTRVCDANYELVSTVTGLIL